jgi:hypothetical protein
MRHRPGIIACLIALQGAAAPGCARTASVLLGHVEADVAGHHVVVTDCYRTSPPEPERLADENGAPVHRYAPCKDAVVTIRGSELEVNGSGYGALGEGDEVLVDHGKVSIHRKRENR